MGEGNYPARSSKMDVKRFVEFGKKIICVGRNYRQHAAELGNAVPDEPLLFMKPTTSYVREGSPIVIPKRCSSLHYEVELGVVISKLGRNIPEAKALSHIGGYALALDMTARDIQDKAKKKGHPWTVAKGYDTFCPISEFIDAEKIKLDSAHLWLKVDGEIKQDGNTKDMIFSVPYLISYISDTFSLEPGDLILTGTPAGVGPVEDGQVISCGLDNVVEMSFPVIGKN